MKHLGLVLVLCGAPIGFASSTASAFEIQKGGETSDPRASLFDPTTQQQFLLPDFKGNSLAMPYSSKDDTASNVSDYGNMIAIPAPGVDRPTPAWAGSIFSRS